jgi:hypothetical protein
LVPVIRVFALVVLFFLFGEPFPLVLVLVCFVAPTLADDLGYLWVG